MKAELILVSGSDNIIVDVARVSYNKESSNYTTEQNKKLLNYLVKHGHTSPFRHTLLQFRLEMPIFVERQMFKHQVGVSANSISGRYVDFSDTYHKINTFRTQSKSSKQGSGENLHWSSNDKALVIQNNIINSCKKAYDDLIELGVSKEQARTVLPLSLNTQCIMSFSLLAFKHLCDLRLKNDTQKETRDLVSMMLDEVLKSNGLEYSLDALGLTK